MRSRCHTMPNLLPHRDAVRGGGPHRERRRCVWRVGCRSRRRCWTICATPTCYVGGRSPRPWPTAAEKLRLIHVAGAGTDKVDFAALSPDMLVANTFHHEQSIAEYVVAAAVMLRRDFLPQDRAAARGRMGDVGLRPGRSRNRDAAGMPASASSASAISASGPGICFAPSAAARRAVTGLGPGRYGRARTGLGGRHHARWTGCCASRDVAVVSAPLTEHTIGHDRRRSNCARWGPTACSSTSAAGRWSTSVRSTTRCCDGTYPGGGDRRLVPLPVAGRPRRARRAAVRASCRTS